jgi:hypothetical protein
LSEGVRVVEVLFVREFGFDDQGQHAEQIADRRVIGPQAVENHGRTRTVAATRHCGGSVRITTGSGTVAVSRHGAFLASARYMPEQSLSP